MDTQEFIQIRRFILKLGKMLHKYGTPSFRLEAYLDEVAQYLGVHASFNSLPTSLSVVIWSDRHEDEYSHVARLNPGELDLNSLSRTDELAIQLLAGQLTLTEADKQLSAIDAMPSPYGKWVTGISYGLSTGAFSLLMGGTWSEMTWSTLLGVVVYLWVLWSERSKRIALMMEPVAAYMVALLACACSRYLDPGMNIPLTILSSVIIFVPGLALTIGLAELSSRNMLSGTARVMDALMQLFKLYFGAYLGIATGFSVFGENAFQPSASLPYWSTWLAVVVLCFGLMAIFKTRPKHLGWALLAGLLAYSSTALASDYLPQNIGSFVGAFSLGILANGFTRIANQPATIVAMHGLIVLVPGSKTYIGLNSFISGQDFVNVEHIGQDVFLIFMSLVAGLIFANVAFPTRKAL